MSRNWIRRLLNIAVATTALGVAPAAQAHAATITLSGTVKGAAGYTLTASAKNGTARSVKLTRAGRFALKLAGAQASLSLIRPNGTYYGPVVLDRVKSGRVHLSVKRSVRLDEIRLAGVYAVVRTPVRKQTLASVWARADSRGKPVGAGRLGLVAGKSRPQARAAQAPPQAMDFGADPDHDGLTNAYDVDDDNDGVLDINDSDAGNQNNAPGRVFTNLWADLPDTLNANVGMVSDASVDALLAKDLTGGFDASGRLLLAGKQVTAVDVNCFTISWCAPGTGTGVIPEFAYGPAGPGPGQPAPGTRFAAFDPNGDGLPNLTPDARRVEQGAFGAMVAPGTGRAGLNPSATLNFRFTTARGQAEYATTFGPSFITTPAIVSLGGQAIAYPVGPNDPGVGHGVDNQRHELVLPSPQVTFTLYPPQRAAIPGAEAPGYYDMGNLRYEVSNPFSDTGQPCPASAFSNLSPTLSTVSQGPDQGVLDGAVDHPANPASAISFTLDLAACTGGEPLTGRDFPLGLIARTNRGENAGTKLWARVAG